MFSYVLAALYMLLNKFTYLIHLSEVGDIEWRDNHTNCFMNYQLCGEFFMEFGP